MPQPRYVAIANPEGKRWQAYAGDLAAFWAERGVRPEVLVVPWRDVVRPGLLYRGFVRVLRGLEESFARRPHLRPLARPLHLAELFDKNATSARLTAAGLPCPPALPGQPSPRTPAELLAAIRTARFPT